MRAGHAEIEVKRLLLGARPVEALLGALGRSAPAAQQTNYVLDTEGQHLRAARYAMRVRDEDGRFFLTAKGAGTQHSSSTVSRAEAEIELAAESARAILEGRLDPLDVLRTAVSAPPLLQLVAEIARVRGEQPLRVIGHFHNARRTIAVALDGGAAFELELDATTYPDGHVEYEAEIELSDAGDAAAAEAWLEALAHKAGVKTASTSPKLARFFAALESAAGAEP